MLSDTAGLSPNVTLETDICIVGAGPAGITLALEFDGQPVRVMLLEGGQLEYDRASQALYKANNVGLHYEYLDHARCRFFGGSSNCWAGFCRPFDRHDFEPRNWVPNSGWPIGRSDLEPYYRQAHEILQLGPFNYDPAVWEAWIDRPDAKLLKLDNQRATNLIAQVSPPTRLGQRYRDAIRRSSNVSSYLNANVTEIETPGNGATVTGLRVRALGGNDFRVVARTYVLATGAIETPRLLLASNRHQSAGVANWHDVVGRYFMDHPRLLGGKLVFKHPERNSRIYDMHSTFARTFKGQGVRLNGFFGLTPETQQAERLGNVRCCVKSRFVGDSPETHAAAVILFRTIHERRSLLARSPADIWKMIKHLPQVSMLTAGLWSNLSILSRGFTLDTIVEPTPLPDSRVTLTTERDALGVPRVQVDWKVGELEKRTMRRSQEILGEELARQGLGTLVADAPKEGEPWPDALNGCWHHMGTTRMHADPRKGVVDANCRAHGMENLFIAGSAVFPTAGSDMPTINIVALAVRMAAHLKQLYGISVATTAMPEPSISSVR